MNLSFHSVDHKGEREDRSGQGEQAALNESKELTPLCSSQDCSFLTSFSEMAAWENPTLLL